MKQEVTEVQDIRLSPYSTKPSEAVLSHSCVPSVASDQRSSLSELDDVRLSPHFKLGEFLNLKKYPENIPTVQVVASLTYGCHLLLEPARKVVGPIIINSGFRSPEVNRKVGGVTRSQHIIGQAADIRPKDPSQFLRLVDFLRHHELTDQLLTGSNWLHVSWNPYAQARHFIRIGYYK